MEQLSQNKSTKTQYNLNYQRKKTLWQHRQAFQVTKSI